MSKRFSLWLNLFLLSGILAPAISSADEPAVQNAVVKNTVKDLKIYSGFYSREGNNDKMAQTTGNNTYVKFYPKKRIVRLYIPYPYAETVKPEVINKAFDAAANASSGSAYIRDKFGVMDVPVVVHLDVFRWIDNLIMYDCSKPEPCRITFDDKSMTVIKPGIVVAHKIHYKHIAVK